MIQLRKVFITMDTDFENPKPFEDAILNSLSGLWKILQLVEQGCA